MALATCRAQRIQAKGFTDQINHLKTSETKVLPTNSTRTNQALIQKDAKLQKHLPYINCQELANSIRVLKADLQLHLNYRTLKHPEAKRTVQVLMPLRKITIAICQQLSKILMHADVIMMVTFAIYAHASTMSMNLTSTMGTQRSIITHVQSIINNKVLE